MSRFGILVGLIAPILVLLYYDHVAQPAWERNVASIRYALPIGIQNSTREVVDRYTYR